MSLRSFIETIEAPYEMGCLEFEISFGRETATQIMDVTRERDELKTRVEELEDKFSGLQKYLGPPLIERVKELERLLDIIDHGFSECSDVIVDNALREYKGED